MVHQTSDATIEDNIHSSVSEITSEIVSCIYVVLVLQALPVFIFANQAGLDMLETTLVALQDITLDKIFDESGRKALFTDFAKLMQQASFTWKYVLFLLIVCWLMCWETLDVCLQVRFFMKISLIIIRHCKDLWHYCSLSYDWIILRQCVFLFCVFPKFF